MIYLAGPIDRVSSTEASKWREYAASKLTATVFDPYSAFGRKPNPVDLNLVQTVNFAAIDECDIMLVNGSTPGGRVTWEEVDYALDHGKAVVIYGGSSNYKELESRGAITHDSLGDAIHQVNKISQNPTTAAVVSVDYTEEDQIDDTLPILKFMVDHEACDTWSPPCPQTVYVDDVGYDLPCARDCVLPPGVTTEVRLAFRVAPPPGFWWRLVGRSSTWRSKGLIVHEGIIDGGYRGPLWAGIHNPTGKEVSIEQGDRLVQCILQRIESVSPMLVNSLPVGDRGDAGFGSSGQ